MPKATARKHVELPAEYEGHPISAPSYAAWVDEALRNFHPDMHLRWDPYSVMVGMPRYDSTGRRQDPEFEGRWEVWSRDVSGRWYLIMLLQAENGDYRPPDRRVVDHMWEMNPANYDGGIDEIVRRFVDEPNEKRDVSLKQSSNNAVDDGVDSAADYHTVKSGAYIRNRGLRLFSGTGGGIGSLIERPKRRRIVRTPTIIVPGGL